MDPAPEIRVPEVCLYFHCNSDLTPESGQEFVSTINPVGTDLVDIAKTQKKIAISLDSRCVPLDKIETNYTAFKEQLQELAKRIKKCKILIKHQSEQLPLLANVNLEAKWQAVTDLELRCYRIKKKNKNLTTLVQSPQYRQALIFYKKTIQECEEPNISAQRLEQLVEETKEQIKAQTSSIEFLEDQNLRSNIELLHQEMFRFLRYAATTISDPSAKERIEKLMAKQQTLESMMQNLSITPPSSDATFQFQNWGSEKLANNRYFKQGIYCADWRYPNIYQIIAPLQEAAKNLQGLEKDLEEQVAKAWQGTFRPKKTNSLDSELALYKEILEILTGQIKAEEQKLYQVPFSTEVHSGLHYVASLFTWVEEIRHTLSFFEKIVGLSWTKISKIQPSLYKSFQEPLPCKDSGTFQSLVAINCLFESIQFLHAASLEDPNLTDPFLKKSKARILTRANESVARIGNALLPVSRREQIIMDCIPKQFGFDYLYVPDFTSNDAIEAGVKSLISKKIIQHFYFTKTQFDLSLDIFLTAVSTQEIFTKFYDPILNYSHEIMDDTIDPTLCLQKMIKSYEAETNLRKYQQLLSKLAHVSHLLYRMTNDSEKGKHDLIFAQYAECQQELFKVAKKAKTTEAKARLSLFITENKQTFSNIKSQCRLPDYCDVITDDISTTQKISDEVMYQWLTAALWAEKPREQQAAQARIEQSIMHSDCNFLSKNITYLLKFLTLRVYNRDSDTLTMPLTTSKYLPLLLAEYIINPASYTQFNPGYVELTIYSTLKVPSIAQHNLLQQALQQHRNTPFFTIWQQAMTSFLAWEKEKTEDTASKCRSVYDLIKKHHSEALSTYYEDILENLLKAIDPSWVNS